MRNRAVVIKESITARDNESIKLYLNEVSKIPLLTPDEEFEIALAIHDETKTAEERKEAVDKLVRHNLRFAVSVAKNYVHQGVTFEDAINECNLGLIEAAQRFDPNTGFKFISYAVWWLKRYSTDFLNRHSRTIRLSTNKAGNINKLGRIYSALEQQLERAPTLEDMYDAAPDYSESDINSFMALEITNTLSLDRSFDSNDDSSSSSTLGNLLESDYAPTDQLTKNSDLGFYIEQFLHMLDGERLENVKYIIINTYGLNGERPKTFVELASLMGVSRERVRQQHDKGIRIIKNNIHDQNLDHIFR